MFFSPQINWGSTLIFFILSTALFLSTLETKNKKKRGIQKEVIILLFFIVNAISRLLVCPGLCSHLLEAPEIAIVSVGRSKAQLEQVL